MGRQLYSYIFIYEENEYELEIIRIFFYPPPLGSGACFSPKIICIDDRSYHWTLLFINYANTTLFHLGGTSKISLNKNPILDLIIKIMH